MTVSSERRLIVALDGFVRHRQKGARSKRHVIPLVDFATAELRARGVPAESIRTEVPIGLFYGRKVDLVVTNREHVLLALLIITQTGSVAKNLHNRYRDVLGDAINIRASNPEAQIACIYLIRADEEATTKRRTGTSPIDEIAQFLTSLQQFRALNGQPLLDASALIAADSSEEQRIHIERVPHDVDVLQGFFDKLAANVIHRDRVLKSS